MDNNVLFPDIEPNKACAADRLVDLYSLENRHFLLPLFYKKEMLLERNAALALNEFMGAADRAGFIDILVTDALVQSRDGECGNLWTGLSVRLKKAGRHGIREAGEWLKAHSAEYGFVLRYPDSCIHITGVRSKALHFRYVGKEAASEIYENRWCLEEYLAIKNGSAEPFDLEKLKRVIAPFGKNTEAMRTAERLSECVSGSRSVAAAGALLRCFFTEGLIRRIAASKYRDNIAVYGGVIAACVIGLDRRVFEDLDTSVIGLEIEVDDIPAILDEIIGAYNDGIIYTVNTRENLMLNTDRPGMRFFIAAELNGVKATVVLDMGLNVLLTPGGTDFEYRLFFGQDSIRIKGCRAESVIAKKLSYLIEKGCDHMRAKDLYDISMLGRVMGGRLDIDLLRTAFSEETALWGVSEKSAEIFGILDALLCSDSAAAAWELFVREHFYPCTADWAEAVTSVRSLAEKVIEPPAPQA